MQEEFSPLAIRKMLRIGILFVKPEYCSGVRIIHLTFCDCRVSSNRIFEFQINDVESECATMFLKYLNLIRS